MEIKYIVGILVIITAIFSGIVLQWQFDKDWISLSRDGDVIAKEKWVVEAERTYINKNSAYRTNIICPRIINKGGYETATRCYYAPDTYELLSRSLINTNIELINQTDSYLVRKSTPNYKYGTNGAYAGYLIEEMIFTETESMEEFPNKYIVGWNPTDTRNYKLVWRVENLKQINIPDGEYHNCKYTFGYIKIDLKDECSKLEKAVVIDQSKIYFYFTNVRGEQSFDLKLIDPTAYLSMEGFSRNITSELGSIINISANISDDIICIDVDHPEYGVNYSTGTNTTTFDLNITYVREDEFNDSSASKTLTSSGQVGITMDNRSDMLNASIDLTSSGTTSGLSLAYGTEGESFNGELQGDRLINTEFKYSDSLYNNTNITFSETGSKYIYFNVSNHPSNTENLTFQISGFEADEGNEVNFYDYFEEIKNSLSYYNESINLAYPLGLFDNFEINTTDNWDVTESTGQGGDDSATVVNATNSYYHLQTSTSGSGATETRYVASNYDNLDFRNNTIIKLDTYLGGSCCIGYAIGSVNPTLYLTDGTNSVLIESRSYGTTSACNSYFSGNLTIERDNHTTDNWQVYASGKYYKICAGSVSEDRTVFNSNERNISTVSFDDTKKWNIKMYTYNTLGSAGSGGYVHSYVNMYRIWTSGIYLNKTDNAIGYNSSTGNFTSDIFHTTASNIIAATLTSIEYKPSGTNIYYYLSADNTNFEQVYSGTRHVFTNSGKNLTYKVMMNTTNTIFTPAVYKLNIQVISLEIENVSIDLSDNHVNEWTYTGVLNSTTSPQNVTLNISDLGSSVGTDYIIKIETDNAGILEINNFNQNTSMSPIELTASEFEECNNCKINFTFSGDNLTVDDLQFDYIGGNKTYIVLAHDDTYSINTSYDIIYYHSKWDYSFPSYVDYLEFIPKSSTTKNVTPYGQDSTRPILNITNLGYGGKNANFSIYLNESYSCVNLTVATSNNKTAGTLLVNSTWNDLSTNTSYLSTNGWWMWADYQCTYSGWRLWEPLLSIRGCCFNCDVCSELVV